jgi:hypothetical protein
MRPFPSAVRIARARRGPLLALLVAVALPYIGRSVSTSDGAEVVSESLGLFVQGSFGYGRMPAAAAVAAATEPPHSRFGLFPSLVPLPALAAGRAARGIAGTPGLETLVACTWSCGVLLAGLAFGVLVRALRADATGPWEAAFVAGTFLWPYAAESFMEPFAAAGIAFGAARVLAGSRGADAALPWAAACLLKPILWATAPVLVLALAVGSAPPRTAAPALRALATFAAVLCLQGAANVVLYGSFLESGYGEEVLRFTTPLGAGLAGLLLLPGRSLFLYAPAVLAGLAGLRGRSRAVVVLCGAAPLLHLLAVARWWSWEGGTAWGPRHLLPVLPLVVAPAVFVAAGAVRALFLAGALVNVWGVLVAPGSWDGYAESLRPPAGAAWPAAGPVRVATVPALSPVRGHAWLAARNLLGLELAKPWLARGAAETRPAPGAKETVSPWLLRRATGLPALAPLIPRLLVRSAAGYIARGEEARALPWLREALLLAPRDPDALRLLAYVEARPPGAPAR